MNGGDWRHFTYGRPQLLNSHLRRCSVDSRRLTRDDPTTGSALRRVSRPRPSRSGRRPPRTPRMAPDRNRLEEDLEAPTTCRYPQAFHIPATMAVTPTKWSAVLPRLSHRPLTACAHLNGLRGQRGIWTSALLPSEKGSANNNNLNYLKRILFS